MATRYSRVFSTTPDLSFAEDNTQSIADFVDNCPLLDGQLIEDITVAKPPGAFADTVVAHSLGRDLKGYIIVKKSAAAAVHESSTVNNKKSSTIILSTNVSCVISLWVF